MPEPNTTPTATGENAIPVRKFHDNDERAYQADAVEALLSDKSVFLSGRAGTGKSSIIKDWYKHYGTNVIRLAPTGVAAINVDGQTIHRFIHWNPNAGVEHIHAIGRNQHKWNGDMYEQLRAIVVDEIGMVRSDLLSMLDAYLRGARDDEEHPFGGVRMIFTGDLLQLPPVVTKRDQPMFQGPEAKYRSPWFFDSPAFRTLLDSGELTCIELKKVYRQDERDFLNLLAGIRLGQPDVRLLDELNRECVGKPFDRNHMTLTPVNRIADQMNRDGLAQLPSQSKWLHAHVGGDWNMKEPPAQEHMELKIGAKVMTLVNDPTDEYVNGSTGTILSLTGTPVVSFDATGETVAVGQHRWSQYKPELRKPEWGSGEPEKIVNVETGWFEQVPLRLAYACSIHKSQGLTLDGMNLALSGTRMFSDGQAYVALSRCKTMEGISLDRPISPRECTAAPEAVQFLRGIGCLSEYAG